jgi:endonuclease/exonuclease/phosphatase family metal-dependent hydrolase
MRIATWNCPKRTIAQCRERLADFSPDILVLQEVADTVLNSNVESWCGWMPWQGFAVAVRDGLAVESEEERLGISSVSGRPFTVRLADGELRILSVWAHEENEPYVAGVHRILNECAEWLMEAPSIVLGDFNAHPRFDKKHPKATFASISERLLTDFGLVSAYHEQSQRIHGVDEIPTYYHQCKKHQPFHLDYCFVPAAWTTAIQSVSIGTFEEFDGFSDHRPVLVEFAETPLLTI